LASWSEIPDFITFYGDIDCKFSDKIKIKETWILNFIYNSQQRFYFLKVSYSKCI